MPQLFDLNLLKDHKLSFGFLWAGNRFISLLYMEFTIKYGPRELKEN